MRAGLILCLLVTGLSSTTAADRPNVLWITCEDIGPQLGCYGDAYSVTPNLDEFAKQSCRYLHCWSNAPVCAPARTTIITGMYPTALGAEHMRSQVKLPPSIQLYPQYLRAAGYYCTNNSKTDYNVEVAGPVWDDSSNQAHWKNRPDGKPFFAIFNHTITHESQIRNAIADKDRIHDPAKARIPAYHPDTPEVRNNWAQYYDRITMMDKLFAKNLEELRDAGLADDTIVFFYGDHGSGMPRSKRFPYNSGLRVPLLVSIPEKWRQLATPDFQTGGTTERLVSFVDLAPTLLSICGVEIPAHMHGHAFLGTKVTEPQKFVYGFRGRMDERIDMIRSLTDGRYVYIRNFLPHRPCGQHVDYMFQTPTTRVWYEMFQRGELNEAQSHFWQPKPPEELYDLQSDPDEVHNLASEMSNGALAYGDQLQRFRGALKSWMVETNDLGLLTEAELHAESTAAGITPYELGVQLSSRPDAALPTKSRLAAFYDLAMNPRTFDATNVDALNLQDRQKWVLDHIDTRPDYWSANMLLGLGDREWALDMARGRLGQPFSESDASAKIVLAEALGRFGDDKDLAMALPVLLEYADPTKHGVYNAIAALNAIDYLDEKAASIKDQIAKLPRKDPNAPARTDSYCPRLIETILSELK